MLQAKNIFKNNTYVVDSRHTHTHTLDKDWTKGYNNNINVLDYLPLDFVLCFTFI